MVKKHISLIFLLLAVYLPLSSSPKAEQINTLFITSAGSKTVNITLCDGLTVALSGNTLTVGNTDSPASFDIDSIARLEYGHSPSSGISPAAPTVEFRHNTLTVDTPGEHHYSIYDISGRLIDRNTIIDCGTIPLEHLAAGSYIVVMDDISIKIRKK